MPPLRPPAAVLLVLALPGQEAEDWPQDLKELSLEELMEIPIETVYGASKQEQSTLEAPSSVSIVTARDIQVHGYRTLADLLRGVRGVSVTDDRNYERLGIRGFAPPGDYNGRALLLVDGHRVNDNIFDSAVIGLDFALDLDLVERVEVIRGPGSSLYGSNAFFGVIDVRTKRGADIGGLELAGEVGSFESHRSRVTYGRGTEDGGDLLLSGTVFGSDGQRLVYEEFAGTPSGGVTDDTDYEAGYSLLAQVARGPWRLQGAYVSREKGIPTGSYGTVFDDPDNHTVDERSWLELAGQHREDEAWELGGRLYYDSYYYRGVYIYDDTANGGPPDLENQDRARGKWWGGELQLSLLSLPRQRLTLGLDYRDFLRRDQANYDTVVYLDDEREGHSAGAFVQDEIRLAEQLTLSAGLRGDSYDTFGSTTNPRLALVFTPDEESAWKLVYGSAFRPPNAYELFYETGSIQKANPDLDPEAIRTLEGIHERYFCERTWRLATSAYYNRIEDLIVQVTDPLDGLLVFQNADDATALGLEAEVEHRFAHGTRVLASGAWQRSEDDATGIRLVNSPELLGKLLVDAPFLDDRLRVGLELQTTSARRTLAGETDDFALVNLTVTRREILPGLTAALSVYNLLDEEYSDPGGGEHVQDELQQDGRTIFFRLSWNR